MKTTKNITIIAAAVVVPTVFLYLAFAFVLWSMQWLSECISVERILFVFLLLLVLLLVASIPTAVMTLVGNIHETPELLKGGNL